MISKIAISLVILSTILLQGCSSIVSGTTQKISVNSNVKGAEVFLNGKPIGKTPVINAVVKRQESHSLMIKKDGYKDHVQTLHTRFDNWFWGNIILGGVVGSTTDALSGTTHLLDPDSIYIELEEDGNSAKKTENKDGSAEIRSFVINSYTHLMKDIKMGSGEHLKSLLSMMKIPQEKRVSTVTKLRSMTELYDTVNDFTEEVVKLYQKQ